MRFVRVIAVNDRKQICTRDKVYIYIYNIGECTSMAS